MHTMHACMLSLAKRNKYLFLSNEVTAMACFHTHFAFHLFLFAIFIRRCCSLLNIHCALAPYSTDIACTLTNTQFIMFVKWRANPLAVLIHFTLNVCGVPQT